MLGVRLGLGLQSPQVKKPVSNSIGGIAIGTAGTTGIYNGYTMTGGDDFDSLDIVGPTNPLGKYFTTHIYNAGARAIPGLLAKSYDSDPLHTGSQDGNRGVSMGVSDSLVVSNSVLKAKVRIATTAEYPLLNYRPMISSMVHSGGYSTVSPPCIIEAYVGLQSGAPDGWHPTFWVISGSPLSGQTNALEFDFPECSSTIRGANTNVHGTIGGGGGGGWISTGLNLTGGPDSSFHLYSLVITAASVLFYIDGALVKTESHDGTLTGKPYYMLITSHSYDSAPNVDVPGWAALGAGGATLSVDYYRAWIPTTQTIKKLTPLQSLPTIKVDYNTSMSYTFPSATALWGSAVSDYCQSVKFEDFEPGNSSEGTINYDQFPLGLSWDAPSRTVSGITTDKKPGRLHTACTPYVSGGLLGIVARGYIDVGPNITTATLNVAQNIPFSYDLYFDCDCGTLSTGKVVSVTGLPAGVTFDPTTFLLSGTPTTIATTSITINCTNASAQSTSKSVNLVVAAASGPVVDGAVTSAAATGTNPLQLRLTTKYANEGDRADGQHGWNGRNAVSVERH